MLAWSLTLAAFSAFASPSFAKPVKAQWCSVPSSALADSIPAADRSIFAAPTSAPNYVGLGVGVQNYTCKAGKFASVGAVAELFDIACLYGSPEYNTVHEDVFTFWNATNAKQSKTVQTALRKAPAFLGNHYFIVNPSGSGSAVPKFDFTSGALRKNPDAFVVAAKAVNVSSPAGPSNVDWLVLNATAGKLASQVFRVDTVAGQPPSSCSESETISVKYTAKYYFYGSTL